MNLLADLPDIDAFPTVDEVLAFAADLAARYPDRVRVRDVGRSRQGDPIQLVSIESATARGAVLVIGQPHPNEPIGMATVIAMCEQLAADPAALEATGASWHFVPCADPDGTRLNEGWFSGPWTREHYARNFYRPASDTQVEWTFPFSTDGFEVNAPMPETQALMAAIDEVRPVVAASLHNGELGGAYFYASTGEDDLYPRLAEVCEQHGIPLHHGDPETPLSTVLGPAVYSVPTAQQIHDLAVTIGADPAGMVSGGSSLDYALRHGPVFGLAMELPYWRDDRAADTTPDPSGSTTREVMLAALDLSAATSERLRALYAAASPLPESPFAEAVGAFLDAEESGWGEGHRQQAENEPGLDRPATVAETFSTRDNVHMHRLRLTGMLLRALPADSPARADVETAFEEWCAEAAADNKAESIPIRDLVRVQADSILVSAEHVLSPAGRPAMTALMHERVSITHGRRSGLPVIVAVHSTALGQAVGGCRLWGYPNWTDGLADALRLSTAMSLKCALAGLALGGGKSVIAVPDGAALSAERREAALLDLGDLIETFEGAYGVGEDVGTTAQDMLTVSSRTRHVYGLPASAGGMGEPSAPTAAGVYEAVLVTCQQAFGSADLAGRAFTIVGLGQVGSRLASLLAADGAKLFVTDVDEGKRDVATQVGADWVPLDEACGRPTDVLVPAALGGLLTVETARELDCAAVVGPANNQLASDDVADVLAARGVLWAPDFLVNAGGVIYGAQIEGAGRSHAEAMEAVEGIAGTLREVYELAERDRSTPLAAATRIATDRIARAAALQPTG